MPVTVISNFRCAKGFNQVCTHTHMFISQSWCVLSYGISHNPLISTVYELNSSYSLTCIGSRATRESTLLHRVDYVLNKSVASYKLCYVRSFDFVCERQIKVKVVPSKRWRVIGGRRHNLRASQTPPRFSSDITYRLPRPRSSWNQNRVAHPISEASCKGSDPKYGTRESLEYITRSVDMEGKKRNAKT